MSWAEEDWTVGLSGRVLQKVKDLQVHHERLSRENKQKQLQLDNLQTSLEKQNAKYEAVRGELQAVQRELRSVGEEVKAAVTSRDRLSQDVQTKQAQVCSLEGQLDALRTLNNKLTQEIKRLEAELEKLQNSTRLTDSALFSTPSWNTNSPWEHNGSRQEGRSDETPSRAHHSRQRLQFSDVSTPQQHLPHRHPSDQSEIFSTPKSVFPWERDDSKPGARRRLPPSSQSPPHDVTDQALSVAGGGGTGRSPETDKSLLEMRSRISSLEEELSANAKRLKSVLNEQTQSKKELAAKEVSLQRAHDELSVAKTRIAQDKEQASAAEHRLKQLQEELKCQRQNAESSRLQHQQRTKELEKQHQRELTELQKERQSLEKQHQQEVNKLNQELQQARTLHNALQAQADKLSLQKQALEKELESVKEKLKWTEGQLKESQKKETQTQAKLTEAVREAEGVAVSLEQSRKRERALEEEGRRLAKELADALRLLKELEEQKSVAAPLPQPVQFCAVGQTVSPQPAYSQPPRSQTKRPAAPRAEQKRVEDEAVDDRRVGVTASYPPDREPGEGIDSEDITTLTSSNSERLERAGNGSNEGKIKSTNEAGSSSVDGDGLTDSEHQQSLRLSEGKIKEQQSISSEDLKRENAMLRSELRDIREELQKRLEDLETQRRAEIETRTRLKQLSRKHTSQAAEKEEKHKEWKTQLESERAETERLKKTLAALEAEMKRSKGGKEKMDIEEKTKEQEDRETEMIELNIQLKQQLAEVKAQLAVEREERKQETEERSQITSTDTEEKKELSMKVAELEAEVEELKRKAEEEEKLYAANNPLTYLNLHQDELNSNILRYDNKLLPSPEQHLLFTQSTNQRNILVSQAEILQGDADVIHPEDSPQSDIGHSLASDLENCLPDETDAPDWVKEVERLKKERAKEMERANQCQGKLEALQSQVTRQTRQLTTAFEKQSQHISGLLAELQEKESALVTQQEELQRCKNELEALKTEEVVQTVEGETQKEDESLHQVSELPQKQEEESPDFCPVAVLLMNEAQRDPRQSNIETCEAETQTLVNSKEDIEAQRSGKLEDSVDSAETLETQRSQNEGRLDLASELMDLRRENQELKQKIDELKVSDISNVSLQADDQEFLQRESQTEEHNAALGLSVETCNDVQAEGEEVLRQNVDQSGDVKIEDEETSPAQEDLEGGAQPQIKLLQQEVAALQRRLLALSEETQQQAEELAVWRLSSQPPPAFSPEEQRDPEEKIPVVRATQHQRSDEDVQSRDQTPSVQIQPSAPGSQRRQENISVIREDELLLSCSSNKLQGRMLFSRLQNLNLPEPKTLQTGKKTSTLQEFSPDVDNTDQEAEKENQEVIIVQQSSASVSQHKARKDNELLQMRQQLGTKEPSRVSEMIANKPASPAGNTGTKLNSSKDADEVKTSSDSSERIFMSVSSQTEERLHPPTVCVMTQTDREEEDDDDEQEVVESPPVSPVPLPAGAESGNQILFTGSFPIPADPARLAERILKNRTQLSAAYDDTEYEPYGLPEVVMKGFADIPTGPSCPYIVRRGLLGTTVVPAATQKDSDKEEETD